ncbi:MAG TPA: COQ9 family protein [Alphaproteobacteria bacterium]|nr:COQ9 family protein [Alphaproteobacteria bacterium]
MTEKDKKDKLLEKFIENCVFDGWNDECLKSSARQLGFENNYEKMLFPQGIRDLTLYFADATEKKFLADARDILSNQLKHKDKAKALMIHKLRLYRQNLKSAEGFKKFASYFFTPANALTGLKGVYNFADDSWKLMNDNSQGFSFYTKRISFGAIYSKAVLHVINDESDNLVDTENFIERKIDDLMKINKIKLKFNELLGKFKL